MQDSQENIEPDDKGVLSPRRLHPDRFSQFTKSSYIPEPAVRETPLRQESGDGVMKSSYQYNGIDKYEKEDSITNVESSKERTRNEEEKYHANYDPLEPLRKNRNTDRHLSAEEVEWETKHLSPKRLDESRWFNFVNELNTDEKPKSPMHQNIQEQKSRLGESPSNVRLSPTSEVLNEINVERSPALRKLMKQDEISEEPFQRTTTRASVQSSPWDGLDTQAARRDSGMRNEQEYESAGNERYVGKIDLKQWNSEVERNRNSFERIDIYREDNKRSPAPLKQNSLRTNQDAQKDEVVIINRNQSPKKADSVYILESNSESTSQERTVRPGSLKYKERVNFSDKNDNSPNRRPPTTPARIQPMVVIKDEQRTKKNDDEYLNRKSVGKVDLNVWEQSASSQYNSSRSAPKDKSPQPMSPKDSFQFDNDDSRQNINKSDTYVQKRVQSNSPQEDGVYTNHRSFNKSMSEDELAWEKRYSKTYERDISTEDTKNEIIQRKVSDQRQPRLDDGSLDENQNYFNFGKISLDEDEVRRVRGNKTNIGNGIDERNEDVYITTKLREDQNRYDRQSSSSPNTDNKYGGDSCQLTEEERAWEEKTGRPGRLDFSKFSQFT